MTENMNYEESHDIITLTLDDDSELECVVLSIFPVKEDQYIALMPVEELEKDEEQSEVLLYRFSESEDGELDLEITSPNATLCLNLCYIKIYLPEDAVATPTPEPTATPVPTKAPEPTTAPTEAPAENNASNSADAPANNDTVKNGSALPWVAGGAVVIGAIAGALAYFFKKRKK